MDNVTNIPDSEVMVNLTSIEDIDEALKQLDVYNDYLSDQLKEVLTGRNALERRMEQLYETLPKLGDIHSDAVALATRVEGTHKLADTVSGKVRALDTARCRCTEAMHRADDVLDLKLSTEGIQSALDSGAYEQAAGHIHRYLGLDETTLIRAAPDQTDRFEDSFKLLHEAETKLKQIVADKFDAAIESNDLTSINRFFKIFPLINQHAEGMARFAEYLRRTISRRCAEKLHLAGSSPGSYAGLLTSLFEDVARVIDREQPLVDTYYGPGHLLAIVGPLQTEVDSQSRAIVEAFQTRSGWTESLSAVAASSRTTDRPDPRQLDPVLSEAALLNSRTSMFLNFIRIKVAANLEGLESKQEELGKLEGLLLDCKLSRTMQELIGGYIPLEEYFQRESFYKAVELNDDTSLSSSMVDDTFFIVKKCLNRALSSSSIDATCAMCNHATSLIESDLREVLYASIRVGFPSGLLDHTFAVLQSGFAQGKFTAGSTESMVKAKTAFLLALNNAATCAEYAATMKRSLEEEFLKVRLEGDQNDAKFHSCLADFAAVGVKFNELVEFGVSLLMSSAIRPQIKPWVESFNEVNRELTEEEFLESESGNPWVESFMGNLDALIATFRESLLPRIFDGFISSLTSEVVILLERSVVKSRFNRLGGLQFDREVRSLTAYLSSATTWSARDKFSRLSQMATLLNLERLSEVHEYWGPNSGFVWRLSPVEARQTLNLRVEFLSEDVRRLKL